MAKRVETKILNGGLGGTLQTNDGIVGMVLTGGIDGGGYALGTPKLLTGLTSMKTAGITTDGNAFAVRQITQFYDTAGDGAQLYLMLVPNTLTIDEIADKNNADGATKLLKYAKGKIKVLGAMTDDTAVVTPTITDGLNADVYTAVVNMQALAEAYFDKEQPFRSIIEATSYNGEPGDLRDMTEGTTYNRVGLLLGDTEAGDDADVNCAACLGLLMGAIAALPVQRKISRVKNGPLPITTAFVGAVAIDDENTDAGTDVIAGNGFITLTTYAQTAGVFFSGDPMCASGIDDYHTLSNGRVIDKAHRLSYQVFVQEVDEDVFVNPEDGNLDVGYTEYLAQTITNQVTQSMSGEISGFTCLIPGDPEADPDVPLNFLSTSKLPAILQVIPKGYNGTIKLFLGLKNPSLNN